MREAARPEVFRWATHWSIVFHDRTTMVFSLMPEDIAEVDL